MALRSNVPERGVSNVAGDALIFSFDAAAGAVPSFISFGGGGQSSLDVGPGREPSATDNDRASTRVGTSQTVRFTAPRAGPLHRQTAGAALQRGERDGASMIRHRARRSAQRRFFGACRTPRIGESRRRDEVGA
ncbi:hypothetical protein A7D17_08560 [Xanthomonas floridensis]|uniref:Uncharacterized protein n=1 Tax=Xanthomonas floridensis TaxID=1843580 RepID=A0A1A9M4S8_9XANT|nr:hypothetical protein A7D17_08560 [Xanthomonas floridensis]